MHSAVLDDFNTASLAVSTCVLRHRTLKSADGSDKPANKHKINACILLDTILCVTH